MGVIVIGSNVIAVSTFVETSAAAAAVWWCNKRQFKVINSHSVGAIVIVSNVIAVATFVAASAAAAAVWWCTMPTVFLFKSPTQRI